MNMAHNWIMHEKRLGINNYLFIAPDDKVYPILEKFVEHVVLLQDNFNNNEGDDSSPFTDLDHFNKVSKEARHKDGTVRIWCLGPSDWAFTLLLMILNSKRDTLHRSLLVPTVCASSVLFSKKFSFSPKTLQVLSQHLPPG